MPEGECRASNRKRTSDAAAAERCGLSRKGNSRGNKKSLAPYAKRHNLASALKVAPKREHRDKALYEFVISLPRIAYRKALTRKYPF